VPETVESVTGPPAIVNNEKAAVPRKAAVRVAAIRKPERKPTVARVRRDPPATVEPRNSDLMAQQPAPRLMNSADVRDNSLRLADVFSELDVNE
jgi:hypothetical protein